MQQSLCQLLEFYFSDENLVHDRFMRSKIIESSEGYIPLSLLQTSFRQLISRNATLEQLQQAVTESCVLELNLDKLSIRRKDNILPLLSSQEELDERTIYLETIPAHMTHEKLKTLLEPIFGEIDYISLPRFESNRKPKGFCFIEFHDLNSVQKILSREIRLSCLLNELFPHCRVITKNKWLKYKSEYKQWLRNQERIWSSSNASLRHPITMRMYQYKNSTL